jgi:hypothetical protein
MSLIDNNLEFKEFFKSYKVIITNLNLPELGFLHKL